MGRKNLNSVNQSMTKGQPLICSCYLQTIRAPVSHRDCLTLYVSKFMPCFTRCGSKKVFNQQTWPSRWCHSTGHTRFPITIPLQLCLYFAPLTRYYHISQNLKRSRDSQHIHFGDQYIMRASISTWILKCLALPIPKIWLRAKLKKNSSCDRDHAN